MPSIDDYVRNPQQALIDAAAEPSLQQFIDPADIELVTIDLGGGRQAQARALARGSVRKVIERILAKARQGGINI
jgi:hypothetical protein